MEVPRPGVEVELQLRPIPQPQQHQTRVTSVTCATACSNTGSLIHWVRPGIKPASSRTLCWESCFVLMDASQIHFHWATMGTPHKSTSDTPLSPLLTCKLLEGKDYGLHIFHLHGASALNSTLYRDASKPILSAYQLLWYLVPKPIIHQPTTQTNKPKQNNQRET